MMTARTCFRCLLALALAACSSTPTEPVEAPSLLVLAIGQSAAVTGGRTITLVDVAEDSRCPVDANCVWAGNLAVVLGAQQTPAGPTTMLGVNTGIEPRRASYDGLQLSIDRALPEPYSGVVIDPEDYRVTLRIVRE